jgi:flagellin-like hook-associated protein FlgL
MADITLTASMRANLLALQSTVNLMGTTQTRLATGLKVNTALDNPTNFFTAQSLNNRSNDLLGYKDGISESIQTIKAADTAISGINTLIQSAKAVAAAAKDVVASATTNQTLTFAGAATAGQNVTIGTQTYTAVTSITSVTATSFYAGGTAAQTAASLAATIAMTAPTTGGGTIGYTVTDNGNGSLNIKHSDNSALVAGDLTTTVTGATESAIANNSTALQAKIAQYNSLITQMNSLQSDANYKGKNLLGSQAGGTDDMTVRFGNNHTLTVQSFNGNATTGVGNLGLDANGATWASEATIQSSMDKMDNALSTLEIQSAALSSNLSIVQTRSDWIDNISNVLKTGASNLTAADSNQEGANMLMLQTRQSLSTSALSMASQSAQSVLKLFQ